MLPADLFRFPPSAPGEWRTLTEAARRRWLLKTRDRHFARHKTNVPVRGRVFTIDGADIIDLSSFLCAMGEAVNGPGGYFGWRWLSFYDCLFGGFGLEMPCQIVWKNAAASKQKMDGAMLARWCAEGIAEIDRSAERESAEEARAELAATLDLARRGERTFFDELVALIEGVRTHELSRAGGIELILELGELGQRA